MVHILGSINDEQCFSLVFFLKNKLCNCLNPQLQLVVTIYTQKFFNLENFNFQNKKLFITCGQMKALQVVRSSMLMFKDEVGFMLMIGILRDWRWAIFGIIPSTITIQQNSTQCICH
jgi:hypothetical protein